MSIELRSAHHLFRYASEWDPREKGKTKGGYLEGSIRLPSGEDGVKVVVSTYPAHLPPGLEESCKDVHPTLLHLVRKTRARRMNEREPVPNIHHWRQEIVVRGKEVSIVNKTSVADEIPLNRNIPPTDKLFDLKEEQVLPFGKDAGELNLIILIPKSDARAQGDDVTLNNLLRNRIDNKDILKQMDENFKGKKSVNLKQVKLKVDFYKLSDDSLISSAISPTISDTASKQLGALDFHDATPLKSCEKGGRKVIMVAEFGLATDVEPRFQLWDSLGNRLKAEQEDKLLKQPKQPVDAQQKETVAVFKESIIFITPDQPNLNLIMQNGFKITLAGRRKSDGWESRKKFPFTYEEHITNCFYCFFNPDGGESCDRGQAKLPLKKEGPRPGRKKRKMSETDDQGDVEMERPDSSMRASTESRTASWSPNSEESVAVGGSLEDRQSAVATCHSQPASAPYPYPSFPVFSPQTQASDGTNEVGACGGGQTSGFTTSFQAIQTYGAGAIGPLVSGQSVIEYTDAAGNIQQANIILQDDQNGAIPQYTDNNTGGAFNINSREGNNANNEAELFSIATQAATQVQNSLTNVVGLWSIPVESPNDSIYSESSIFSPPGPTPSPPHSIETQSSSEASQINMFGATYANIDNSNANTDGLHLSAQMDTGAEETLPSNITDLDWIYEDGAKQQQGYNPNMENVSNRPNLSTKGSSVENLQSGEIVQEEDKYPLPFSPLGDIFQAESGSGGYLSLLGDIVQDGSSPRMELHAASLEEPTRRVLVRRDTSTQEEDTEHQEDENEEEEDEHEQPAFYEKVLQKFSKLPFWFAFFFILAKWYWGDTLSFIEGVTTTLLACVIMIVVKDKVFGNIV